MRKLREIMVSAHYVWAIFDLPGSADVLVRINRPKRLRIFCGRGRPRSQVPTLNEQLQIMGAETLIAPKVRVTSFPVPVHGKKLVGLRQSLVRGFES